MSQLLTGTQCLLPMLLAFFFFLKRAFEAQFLPFPCTSRTRRARIGIKVWRLCTDTIVRW